MSPLALSLRFLQTQPDARLVELARAGHERAFEALVHRYRVQLLHYCRRLSGSDAEDALQQALLQAWVALSNGTTEVREARAWLYRIAHNVTVSNLRNPSHDPEQAMHAAPTNSADQELERQTAVRDTLAGVAALPDLQRKVMLSMVFEGHSHDEIAAALGLSHGAVRGLMYRARATLRAAAAAVMPAPLINWALRQGVGRGPGSAGSYEAIAGGGYAGLGAVLVKSGALVVTAGALASATGIAPSRSVDHAQHRAMAAAVVSRPAGSSTTPLAVGAAATSLSGTRFAVTSGAIPASAGTFRLVARATHVTAGAAAMSSGQRAKPGRPPSTELTSSVGSGGPGTSRSSQTAGGRSGGDHGGGGSGGSSGDLGSGGSGGNGGGSDGAPASGPTGQTSGESPGSSQAGSDHSSKSGASSNGSDGGHRGGSTTAVTTSQTPSGGSGGGNGDGQTGGDGLHGNAPAAVITTPPAVGTAPPAVGTAPPPAATPGTNGGN